MRRMLSWLGESFDHWYFGCFPEPTGNRSRGGQPEYRCPRCGRTTYGRP
jgi:hypothetical protein